MFGLYVSVILTKLDVSTFKLIHSPQPPKLHLINESSIDAAICIAPLL